MAEKDPVVEAMLDSGEATTLPWAEARGRLADAGTCWLVTVRPDGRPHVVPIGAVWWEGAFYITTGQGTRKGANLAENPHCALAFSSRAYDVMVEGTAAPVREAAKLEPLSAVYRAQGWPATAGAGAFDAPYSAPTTGPAPYDVYEVTPTVAFALGTTEETVNACTRYRF
jgi:nitroimidazol reductase NimA-like FMN-containing flavoprotein (pyridoxamine 5'-phosphate oxidase superfamily)